MAKQRYSWNNDSQLYKTGFELSLNGLREGADLRENGTLFPSLWAVTAKTRPPEFVVRSWDDMEASVRRNGEIWGWSGG